MLHYVTLQISFLINPYIPNALKDYFANSLTGFFAYFLSALPFGCCFLPLQLLKIAFALNYMEKEREFRANRVI